MIESACVICGLDANNVHGPVRSVKQKGKETLVSASIKKSDKPVTLRFVVVFCYYTVR